MTTLNPCTRCNGSGTEPDPVLEAARKHAALVNGLHGVEGALKDKLGAAGAAIHAAALDERAEHEARISILEAALRDILNRFPHADALQGDQQFLRVPNEDVGHWRKILGDAP